MASLKDEMTSDLADAVVKPETVTTRRTKKTKEPEGPPVHAHGNGACNIEWIDEDGRRRTRPHIGRIPLYVPSCKACAAEDKARMEAEPVHTDEELENTVFFVPERELDRRVVQAYLEKRYPGAEIFSADTIRPLRLATRKGSRIVVVTRRPLPGAKSLGVLSKMVEDKFGNLVEQAIDPAEHIAEVVESAPVIVQECVSQQAATMYDDAAIDLTELSARLGDLALPRYYVAQYKRVVGSDEYVFTLRTLG